MFGQQKQHSKTSLCSVSYQHSSFVSKGSWSLSELIAQFPEGKKFRIQDGRNVIQAGQKTHKTVSCHLLFSFFLQLLQFFLFCVWVGLSLKASVYHEEEQFSPGCSALMALLKLLILVTLLVHCLGNFAPNIQGMSCSFYQRYFSTHATLLHVYTCTIYFSMQTLQQQLNEQQFNCEHT